MQKQADKSFYGDYVMEFAYKKTRNGERSNSGHNGMLLSRHMLQQYANISQHKKDLLKKSNILTFFFFVVFFFFFFFFVCRHAIVTDHFFAPLLPQK